ncbi:DUF2793 domain-containing protein [Pseudooctadecabacter jejudonensis]|uniref:DUF2793 domain-containing protein n=1 Tax=Pseudooctadecabacter jejudonensis TaxID=1391910 RepID=A0A1Y5TEM3_9RHOB|nr:DUF2793 domain-containing protein [Pseudooctadecabacter jejudonensis]SLN62012.1 hypothetical protein PSJ8397_03288 [Pseudooctadecabacter jejudonensis]
MSETSPILGLPYIQPAQAQKHVTHNEALAVLEAAVQLTVVAHDAVTPPAAPAEGDRYIVPAGAEAAWGGAQGDIAVWDGVGWNIISPKAGWQAYSQALQSALRFDGTDWQADGGGSSTQQTLGINTTADTTNRLSVAADATLLNHEGAGHQVKVNKAATPDTASLLFQTGFSGRAEMGTAGNDAFAIKVSDDGASWTTALSFDPATGVADGAAIQATPNDTGTGKLARADYAYGPGNALGPVGMAGGLPTGGLIERGTNTNGDFVRFADGTQICWSPNFAVNVTVPAGAIFQSPPVTWTYPASFVAAPSMTQGGQNHATVYWTVVGTVSMSSGTASAMSFQSISSRTVKLMAFGRWI